MEDTTIPSDSNGVYSLPSGYEAVTGEVIQASQHNPPLEDLASAMSQRLMRSGAAPMTGPLKIADGSVGSPGLKFSSDGTTGLYKTAGGIGVSVGGVKVAEFTSSGVSRMLGELIPWAMLSAPAGWVLPYGQTLSRATYADLWAAAQTEIAGGNIFFNNGDGSTTFGIGDLRGRVVAGKDSMGGSDAGRLTTTTMTTVAIGGTGGAQTQPIAKANLPNTTFAFAGTPATIEVNSPSANVIQGAIAKSLLVGTGGEGPFQMLHLSSSANYLFSSGSYTPAGTVSSGGSGTALTTIQPTMICNYLLYAGA